MINQVELAVRYVGVTKPLELNGKKRRSLFVNWERIVWARLTCLRLGPKWRNVKATAFSA